jgi:molybdopterin converting factor small subunit
MAVVRIPTRLQHLSGGLAEVRVDADDVRRLIEALERRFPGLGKPLREAAVAIDGEILNDPYLEAVATESEVDFLPRLSGG